MYSGCSTLTYQSIPNTFIKCDERLSCFYFVSILLRTIKTVSKLMLQDVLFISSSSEYNPLKK